MDATTATFAPRHPNAPDPLQQIISQFQQLQQAAQNFQDPAHIRALDNNDAPWIAIREDMTNLQNETMSYTQTHQGKVEVVKRDVEVVKDDLANDIIIEFRQIIRPQIVEATREEIRKQLAAQVPSSLEAQIKEDKDQLDMLQIALANSESRLKHSTLEESDLDEVLYPVFNTTSGQLSKVYPLDLRSLWAYSLEQSKELLQGYDLQPTDDRTDNFNKFLTHIGVVKFRLIPIQYAKP